MGNGPQLWAYSSCKSWFKCWDIELQNSLIFYLEDYQICRTQQSDISRFNLLIVKKVISISWLRWQLSMVVQWWEKVKDVYRVETTNTRHMLGQCIVVNTFPSISLFSFWCHLRKKMWLQFHFIFFYQINIYLFDLLTLINVLCLQSWLFNYCIRLKASKTFFHIWAVYISHH